MQEVWTQEIKPKSSWFDIRLGELWRYRDLVLLFVRRDFVSFYKQTILGPLWFFIQPLLTTFIFVFIFSNIAGISTDSLPPILFYLAGTVVWNYFAESINKTSGTFINNAQIFGKVYFPRLTVPFSIIISNLFTFGIQMLCFIGFLVYFKVSGYNITPNWYMLLLPVQVLIMALLGLGLGIIISSLTTKYRDLRFMVTFGVQLLMYATTVIYPLSSIPDKYKIYILANPMTAIIESFRFAFLGTGTFNWWYLLYSAGFAIVIFFIGVLLFNRIEKNFMDVV